MLIKRVLRMVASLGNEAKRRPPVYVPDASLSITPTKPACPGAQVHTVWSKTRRAGIDVFIVGSSCDAAGLGSAGWRIAH
jgi:hypothetical protein